MTFWNRGDTWFRSVLDETRSLVEQGMTNEALEILRIRLDAIVALNRLPAELANEGIVTARALYTFAEPATLVALYQASLASSNIIGMCDVMNLASLDQPHLARLAARGIAGTAEVKWTAIAYTVKDSPHFEDLAVRFLNANILSVRPIGGTSFIEAIGVGLCLRKWTHAEAASLNIPSIDFRCTEAMKVFDSLMRGDIAFDDGVDYLYNISSPSDGIVFRTVVNQLVEWTASIWCVTEAATDRFRSLSPHHGVKIEGGKTQPASSNDAILRQMTGEMVGSVERTQLNSGLHHLLSGDIQSATECFADSAGGEGLGRTLGLTCMNLIHSTDERTDSNVKEIETAITSVFSKYGPGSLPALALQIALISRLVRSGKTARAKSELSLFNLSVQHLKIYVTPAQNYFKAIIDIYESANLGSVPKLMITDDPIVDAPHNWYAQLHQKLVKRGAEDSAPDRGMIHPAIRSLRELKWLEVAHRYREFVDAAGKITDELVATNFGDEEFIFQLRLRQAIFLERLGRLRHAQRVLKYVLSRAESAPLSLNLRSQSRALLARTTAALSDTDTALGLLSGEAVSRNLESAELYVRSLVLEATGDVDEAIEAANEAGSTRIDEVSKELLSIESAGIKDRIRHLHQYQRRTQQPSIETLDQ